MLDIIEQLKGSVFPCAFNGLSSGEVDHFAAFQNPDYWYDFKDAASFTTANIGYGSGVGIESVANKGAAGDAPLARASGSYITDEGGHGLCNGSQNGYEVGAAGDFDFLHDGSGGQVFYILEFDSAATSSGFLHMTNVNGGSNDAGQRFMFNQTSGNNRLQSVTATTGGAPLNHLADAQTLTRDLYHIAEMSIKTVSGTNDIICRDDGVTLISAADGGILTANSHADAARFLVGIVGNVKGVFAFKKRPSDAERYAFYKKAASYYGLPALNVSLMIGDSNAGIQGAYSAASAAYQDVIEGAYIYAHAAGDAAGDLGFWPLDDDTTGVVVNSGGAGADLALMHHMHDASGAKECLIKSYENGSDLYAKWNPTDFPELASSWDALAERVAAVKAWAANLGRAINWRGCWQLLGHNDCSQTYRSDSYATNLANLITDLREMTRADLPMVVTVTSLEGLDNPDAGFTVAAHQATVRDAIIDVCAADSNAYAYQPQGIVWNEATPNGIHYDMATLEVMGAQVAQGLLAASAPAVSVSPSIAGGTSEGSILTLDAGSWANDLLELRIQWQRDGVAISGATGWQHTATDAGSYSATGVGVNAAGESASFTTAAHVVEAAAPSFDPTSLPANIGLTRLDDAMLYQDAAATTPAGVGDPVGWIEDLTGNGLHFTQSIASARPTLRVDVNGHRYLEWDGVDDTIVMSASLPADSHTLGIAANHVSADRGMLFTFAAQSRYIGLYENGSASPATYGLTEDEVIVDDVGVGASPLDRDAVFDAIRGKTATVLKITTSNALPDLVSGVGVYGAGYAMEADTYGLLVANGVTLTDEQITAITAWWQEGMGV